MSKKTKNASPAAPVTNGWKKWLVIAIAAVVVLAAAVLTWYLLRYQFNNTYRQYVVQHDTAPAGSAFTALEDAEPSVEGYALVAQNDILKLYCDPATGAVAVYDLRTGVTTWSNPPQADKDKVANKVNRGYLKSQVMVDYYNAALTTGSFSTFADAVDLGEMRVESIPGGVRFIYDLGEKVTIYYIPEYLSAQRFDELFAAVPEDLQEAIYGRANSFYEQREDGNYYMSEKGSMMAVRTRKKVSDAFLEAGLTEEEYYYWQELGGVEVEETLGFTVALDWTLEGDSVLCTVPVELLEERGGGMIYRIQLNPYFAAAGTDETGYMVVPNGSGSLIRFNNGKQTNAQYSQYVYDMDLVDAEYTKTQNLQSVRLPIFAICREDSTVLAEIEQGETFANIVADVSGRNNGYNNVFAIFTIRGDEKLAMFGAGETADLPIVEKNFYEHPMAVRYTFLPPEYTGYTGVANYYRETLIARGVLTPKAEGGDIPFYYDVIGGVKETAHTMGVQHLQVTPMTTFEQAGEMAGKLKALGIANQVMNFQGWMNGGYHHDVADRVKVLRQLGGKSDLMALAEAMQAYGEIYLDVAFQNVTYISKRYNISAESSRYYGAGYAVQFGETNPTNLRRTASLGYAENIFNLLSPKFLPHYVSGFTKAIGSYDESLGISLRDLGWELHADKKRTGIINREEALDVVVSQLEVLKETGRSLMISGGNLYALSGVKHILGAPLNATEYFIVDETIPLYQMVVHGCIDYTGQPMNTYTTDSTRRTLLEMVEYGASLRYTFTWEAATEMKYTGLNKYYSTTFDSWAEDAAENYAFVNGALSHVSNAFMVNREVITATLVRVDYSNGVSIYINYGSEAAQADGCTVEPMSYFVKGGVNE
ncbi:MAG: hypothetical protein IKK57_01490 [Clostridia bacterium]|nr:hypothetical protein [Clostridia bacterium]